MQRYPGDLSISFPDTSFSVTPTHPSLRWRQYCPFNLNQVLWFSLKLVSMRGMYLKPSLHLCRSIYILESFMSYHRLKKKKKSTLGQAGDIHLYPIIFHTVSFLPLVTESDNYSFFKHAMLTQLSVFWPC